MNARSRKTIGYVALAAAAVAALYLLYARRSPLRSGASASGARVVSSSRGVGPRRVTLSMPRQVALRRTEGLNAFLANRPRV